MTEDRGASIPDPPRPSEVAPSASPSDGRRVIVLPPRTVREPAIAEFDPAHVASHEPVYYVTPIRRRVRLPVILFLVTAVSTYWAGATGRTLDGPVEIYKLVTSPGDVLFQWKAPLPVSSKAGLPAAVLNFLQDEKSKDLLVVALRDGLQYMAAVMAILLAHELGHFFQAVRYGIPASLPFFIPMPLTPLGTMGAVIAMRGSQANRLELFDIGISGPLAGLVVAIPVAWFGIATATTTGNPTYLHDPLIMRLMVDYLHPELRPGEVLAWNPLYMAGWVGMLITGLNMMPISQLDGGHISYALWGKRAHLLARGVVLAAVVFILAQDQYTWAIMLALVVYLGTDHPRTADDYVPLGIWRRVLGWASFVIPVLCFIPVPMRLPV
ncbi:MAG TPA: site-2 protease family protein [Pirellulales bacterium]|nr:site-2 protease family protein [Pirellulales bacterium]